MDQRLTQTNASAAWTDVHSPLPKHSVYRSPKGRAQFQAYYDSVLGKLPYPVQTEMVATSFGNSHVAMMGNPNGSPILVLPGMSICGPIMLEYFAYLGRDHWLIAPDLIGQPGRSADTPFSLNNNAYGTWLGELLDGLGIEKLDAIAASFGGSISLELQKLAPERVGKHALVVTAGLTPKLPYLKIYAKLLLTWLAYRFVPIKSLLPKIARPLSRHLTAENLNYLDIIIRQTAFWQHRPAGPFFKEDMPENMEPVFIVFGKNDILFPYEQTRQNAHSTLEIGQEFILTQSAHMPGDKEMAPIHKEIEAYFKS